jgi:hypothetical protein
MTDPSPQLPPQTLHYAQSTGGPDLRTLAFRQRALNVCILAYIVLFASQFALPRDQPVFLLILGVALLATVVTAAVFVFMLSVSVYGTGIGILMGVLTLIPLVGLIVLLLVNSRATATLRKNNIKVGLLGADPSRIAQTY